MFRNVAELVQQATERNIKLYEIMLEQEEELTGVSKEEIIGRMLKQFQVMKQAALRGMDGVTSHSGMTGGDGKRLNEYIKRGTT